jgi:antitoxin CptB
MSISTESDSEHCAARKRRLQFRASHRGTKEADMMIGGFVDSQIAHFSEDDIAWLEKLLEEQDVDIMAWITKSKPTPAFYDTALMLAMQKLDYLNLPNR